MQACCLFVVGNDSCAAFMNHLFFIFFISDRSLICLFAPLLSGPPRGGVPCWLRVPRTSRWGTSLRSGRTPRREECSLFESRGQQVERRAAPHACIECRQITRNFDFMMFYMNLQGSSKCWLLALLLSTHQFNVSRHQS